MTPVSAGSITLSAAVVAAAIIGLFVARSRATRMRMIVEAICLTLCTALLFAQGQSPILHIGTIPTGPAGVWVRAAAAGWWIVGARVAVSVTVLVLGHDARSREARLFSDLLAAAIYLAVALIILNSVLNLPVNGVLATSGVIAIVIGLALQNTLADVFSGIAVGVEGPFRVGDRVSLGDIEGVVVQMNWRSVRVQTDGEDVASVPNSRVARSEIVNRSFPTQRRTARVELFCSASATPEAVFELLQQATLLCPEILQSPAPSMALTRLGMKTNAYAVDFYVAETPGLAATKGRLLNQIRRQLHHAGLLDPTSGQTGERSKSAFERFGLLRSMLLFETLDTDQITTLASTLREHPLDPGAPLFSQGSLDATLYVVASGVLEITCETDVQGTLILGRIGAGDYIGEICLLTGAPHPATAIALTHGTVYSLDRAALEPLFAEIVDLAPAFERSVRRGMELIRRGVAAQVGQQTTGNGPLLDRIRGFFHHGRT